MLATLLLPMTLLAFLLFLFSGSIAEAVGGIYAILLVGGLLATGFLGLSSLIFAGSPLRGRIEQLRTTTYLSVPLLSGIVYLSSGLRIFASGWLLTLTLMLITFASSWLYLRGGIAFGEQ